MRKQLRRGGSEGQQGGMNLPSISFVYRPTALPPCFVNHVLFFARAPRPGQVKTRLAADVGSDVALEIYRALGSRVVDQIAGVSSITVWYEPADAEEEMRAWLGDLRFEVQPDGDLGARLTRAFAAHPSEPAIAVGADAPDVDAAAIESAGNALRATEVVLGPANDGGYYLIGLARPLPKLFQALPWGTDEVLDATRAACDKMRITPALLPVLRDVDRLSDLKALGLWPS